MVSAEVGAFEVGPERRDTVGVRLSPDVLGDRVVDALVGPVEVLVGHSVVGVDGGGGVGAVEDKAVERGAVGVGDNRGANLVGVPVLHAHHGGLADRAPTGAGQGFTAGVGHVAALTTHVGFINFDRAETRDGGAGVVERRAEPMEDKPRGSLRDAEVPVQLHAGDALEARDIQADGDSPQAEGHAGALQRRVGGHAEPAAASRATSKAGRWWAWSRFQSSRSGDNSAGWARVGQQTRRGRQSRRETS